MDRGAIFHGRVTERHLNGSTPQGSRHVSQRGCWLQAGRIL